jgi:hypothetical protein
MKLLFACLGCFIFGVLVGARMWIALIFCAALVALWWFGLPRPPPDRLSRRNSHFDRSPRRHGH